MPRYNKSSIKILEDYAKKLNITDLQHAENGGEYKVLGYYVDGYSPTKNIVLEYDEGHHFDTNGNLLSKDKSRQLEIEEYLGCTFIRIKQ
jgi:very-short-patch-repair endonuclease